MVACTAFLVVVMGIGVWCFFKSTKSCCSFKTCCLSKEAKEKAKREEEELEKEDYRQSQKLCEPMLNQATNEDCDVELRCPHCHGVVDSTYDVNCTHAVRSVTLLLLVLLLDCS